MTFREFIQETERVGFYIIQHDFPYSINSDGKNRSRQSILCLRGRYVKFRYAHSSNFKFQDEKINNYYDAYKHILNSLVQEVIDT